MRTSSSERVASNRCARATGSTSPQPRCSFRWRIEAVASVVTGMRSADEVEANLAHCRAVIPNDFWDELKHEGLIASHAPVGMPSAQPSSPGNPVR